MSCLQERAYIIDVVDENVRRYAVGFYCAKCGSFTGTNLVHSKPDFTHIQRADIQQYVSVLGVTPCDEQTRQSRPYGPWQPELGFKQANEQLDPRLKGKARYDALRAAILGGKDEA